VVLKNFFKVTPEKRQVRIKSKKGVVYNNPRWWKKIIFYFGSVLVIISLIFILYIYEPIMIGWVHYKLIDQSKIEVKIAEIESQGSGETLAPEPTLVKSSEFKISIPKIGAETDIQQDVSPYDKEEYLKVLKKNVVAQALGTAFPGDGDGKTMFLFAHSSEQRILNARDNPVFYLLGKLENDDVILINYRGEIFTYRVYTKKVVKSKETDYLNYSENGKEILILQTCWPIGTNWQRLLIFAEKI